VNGAPWEHPLDNSGDPTDLDIVRTQQLATLGVAGVAGTVPSFVPTTKPY
jgi:hypothetical protein